MKFNNKNLALGLAAAFAFSTASLAQSAPALAPVPALSLPDITKVMPATVIPDTTAIRNQNDTTSNTQAATVIKGRVDPINAAVEVWAISGSDSLKVGVEDGTFIINGKPGIYKVVVIAKVPYKDVIKDDVQVANGNTTDLGTIRLQQ
jgi:hypothetical protein